MAAYLNGSDPIEGLCVASIEETIGARVARLRRELGMTQAELGQAMEPYTGLVWSRANVSNAEAGVRAWTASDVLAACMVLGVSPAVLFTPLPDQIEGVQAPSGRVITSDEMRGIVTTPSAAALSDESAVYVATEANRLRGELSRLTEVITTLFGMSAEPNQKKEG